MHIGIDASRAITEQRTGTEAYARHLIEAFLPIAVAEGHTVSLYFNAPTPTEKDSERSPFRDYERVAARYIPMERLWTHVRLARELKLNPPDIFFTPAHVIPYTYRGPAVATVHDLGYHHFPDAHPRTQRLYLQWSTRHNATRSRIVLADSEATKRDLTTLYDIPDDKIHVVYPGPTPGLERLDDMREIRRIGRKYNVSGRYLLFLSTVQPRKNVVRLISAYERYVRQAKGRIHRLVIAGRLGWNSTPIQERLSAIPYPHYTSLHMPGFIDEADKAALISGATALVYPSLYEGFGFPVLEANACGTPVLTANTSSLPEVAGDAALYVDPLDEDALYDGLVRMMEDEALRTQLIAAGYENLERFSWQKAAEQTLATLEEAARV